MTTIEIPLRDTDEVIELDTDSFPEVDEVLNILKQEVAPMHVWILVALEYYRSKKYPDFVKVLNEANINASVKYADAERDQVKVLDMLANYYVKQASKEKTKEKKRELFGQAAVHFTTADRIAMFDHNHLLSRAFFFLFEGDNWSQLDNQLNFVLTSSPNSVPALLGKSCIAYNKKEYRQALSFYRKALRNHPRCPASVRLGMGHCFFRLGNLEKAKFAFERALALDPECVGALVGLAVLELNEKTLESVHQGVQKLSKAYLKDSNNPMVLNHLADHFFYAHQYKKVHTLALHAFHYTENELMRAQSCYQIARGFHKEENYDEAFQYYYQATQFASNNFVMPFYGLGQMYLYRKDIENAISSFEKVLKVYPNNYETLKILGSLYAQSDREDRRELAKKMFQNVTEIEPDDLEAWIEYAQLLKQDTAASLEAYTKAINLLRSESLDIPPEILNNVGVLHQVRENYSEARKYYSEALERIEELKIEISSNQDSKQDDINYYVGLSVSINYNQGRLFEAEFQTDQADMLYKSILKQFPEYLDCHLRLGCMARDRGQIYDASDWFKDALKVNPDHPDSWSLMGLLHLSKSEAGPAQKKFEYIVRQNPNDIFANVALGNIWLNTLFHPSRDKEKEKRHQERALTHYRNVLRIDPKNILAAHGIGAVLAHKGYVNEARDVFAQVREATADFPDVWINIAHIYVEQKQYLAAIQMYENCIKKFNKQTNTELLLYLARAHFKCDQLKKCKQVLLKARHIAPWDPLIAYNLAFVQKRWALSVVPDEKSNFSSVLEGINDLNMAQCTFKYLSSQKDQINIPQLPNEIKDCQDLLSQARYYLDRATKREQQERYMRQKQVEERESIRKSQLTKQQDEENMRLEREKKLEEERNKFIEKAGPKLIIETKTEGTNKKEKKSGQKRAKTDEFIDDIQSNDSDENNNNNNNNNNNTNNNREPGEPSRKKSKKDKSLSGVTGGKSSKHSSGKKSKKISSDQNDSSQRNRPKVISKATVSDSDDDDSSYHSISEEKKIRLATIDREESSGNEENEEIEEDEEEEENDSSNERPSGIKSMKRKKSGKKSMSSSKKQKRQKLIDSDSESQQETTERRRGMMDDSTDEEPVGNVVIASGQSKPLKSVIQDTSSSESEQDNDRNSQGKRGVGVGMGDDSDDETSRMRMMQDENESDST